MRRNISSLLFLALTSSAFSQQFPTTMTKVVIRLQNPSAPNDSFTLKPKTMYRAGTTYCRIEEQPDPERGIHGVVIINGPDVWMVNLLTKTARHMIDPGPTYGCRLPVLEGSSLTGLEIGRELSYFKAKSSSKQGSILRGRTTSEYLFDAGDSRVSLYTTGTPERPWVITRQRGKDQETYWYEAHDELPFDSRQFTKPDGVRIEDAK